MLFEGIMLPIRSNNSSASSGVICATTHIACCAASGVHRPSTTPSWRSIGEIAFPASSVRSL